MEIQNLVPVNWCNQRVVLTAQLAQVYNTTTERISHNFSENQAHFKEGEHYFKLTGAALREFKKEWGTDVEKPQPFSKMASCLYLWTKKGCVRHCKMLNTPKAWEMFDQLEKNYFEQKTAPQVESESPKETAPQVAPESSKKNVPDVASKIFGFLNEVERKSKTVKPGEIFTVKWPLD